MAEPYTRCGTLGDRTFQRNRWGQISYDWHAPAYRNTTQQQFVRNNWREVSRRWSQITEEQRLSWRVAAKEQWSRRRLGKRYPLKGYYYYMRINVALANRGQPLLDLPPGDPAPAGLSQPLLTNVWQDQPDKLLTLCAGSKSPAPAPSPPPSG
jgi:hypothetical protein